MEEDLTPNNRCPIGIDCAITMGRHIYEINPIINCPEKPVIHSLPATINESMEEFLQIDDVNPVIFSWYPGILPSALMVAIELAISLPQIRKFIFASTTLKKNCFLTNDTPIVKPTNNILASTQYNIIPVDNSWSTMRKWYDATIFFRKFNE